ncbi:MAG: MmgE/PrpD family protein [Chloroflexi bacterium]|nr:MmgE/PrpD family protein [Chloroflexota bacterium]
MGVTENLAKFVVETRFTDLPGPGVHLAKLCILDAVGCALYSSTTPVGRIMVGFARENGGSPVATVLGTQVRTSSVNAALTNGTLANAEDYDSNGPGGGLVMAAVLALGEELQASGKDILTAYLVGFEVLAKVGQNIGGDVYGRGWHAPSVVGTLGATAAAAKLLRLDVSQTCMALGIAASQSSGLRGNAGSMTKGLHTGNAARAAVTAAKLALRGMTANPGIMEHRFGYVAVFGEQQAQLGHMGQNIGKPWAIMGEGVDRATGARMKAWPCGVLNHGPITGMLELAAIHRFRHQDIEAIRIETPANPLTMGTYIKSPTTGFEGKFSTWYTVAAAAIDGKIGFESFTDEAVNRPEVKALLKRVEIQQAHEYIGRPPRVSGGEGGFWNITVLLRNGNEVSTQVSGNGRSLNGDQIIDKYLDLARRALPEEQAKRSQKLLVTLDSLGDTRELMASLTPGPPK